MLIFLDSLIVSEIRELSDMGLVDGITSNPTLVKQSGIPFIPTLKEICSFIKTSISAEVSAIDYEGMIKEGEQLASIGPQITIKLPLTSVGLKACRYFSQKGIPVNITLCFSPAQALLAAKAGATYVSPFVGRLEDNGGNGIQLIKDIVQIFKNYPGIETKILAASIRNVEQVIEVAKAGADVVTLPPSVLRQMILHPLTDKGLATFVEDWKKSGQLIVGYE